MADSDASPKAPARKAKPGATKTRVAETATAEGAASLPSGDPVGATGSRYDMAAVRRMIVNRHVNSAITRLSVAPRDLATQNNEIQRIAEGTRLGIPVTISTDPRNHFQAVLGASTRGGGFSLWPETLGFAALRDPERVRRFGAIARAEYRAVGIHMALSPQADLASEPRWPRVTATFGSDPTLVSTLVGAYISGFQGGTNGLSRDGVATIVKHWVGWLEVQGQRHRSAGTDRPIWC